MQVDENEMVDRRNVNFLKMLWKDICFFLKGTSIYLSKDQCS